MSSSSTCLDCDPPRQGDPGDPSTLDSSKPVATDAIKTTSATDPETLASGGTSNHQITISPSSSSSHQKNLGQSSAHPITSTTHIPEEAVVILPPTIPTPKIIIEFCDRCRWAPRATWIQTELFLTFPTPLIQCVSLIPLNAPETGGRFRVWLDCGSGNGNGNGNELIWDRKTEGGFPELKVLKQRIRNRVQPDLSLGHSDVHGTKTTTTTTMPTTTAADSPLPPSS